MPNSDSISLPTRSGEAAPAANAATTSRSGNGHAPPAAPVIHSEAEAKEILGIHSMGGTNVASHDPVSEAQAWGALQRTLIGLYPSQSSFEFTSDAYGHRFARMFEAFRFLWNNKVDHSQRKRNKAQSQSGQKSGSAADGGAATGAGASADTSVSTGAPATGSLPTTPGANQP